MRKTFITVFAILLAAFALPSLAAAQGNAGGDQYEENVPKPGGNGNGNGNGGNGGNGSGSSTSDPGNGSGGGSLPPGVAEDFAEQGEDGAAAANLAEQTSPGDGDGGEESSRDGASNGENGSGGDDDGSEATAAAGSDSADSGSGGSPVADVAQTATGTDGGGEGGTSLLVPIVIGLGALGALAFVLVRRTGTPGAA